MRPFARAAAALAAAAIVLAAGIPVMAAGSAIRWVDDDGRAGPSGCDAGATVPRRIGPALDAARPGDTVRVCPGTYRELVTVATAEVTLEAAVTHGATIVPPAVSRAGAVVTVDSAPGARVIGFAVRVPSAASADGCAQERNGIDVFDSPGATIRANDVRGVAGRYSGRCGLRSGIQVLGSPGVSVAWNAVRDWQLMGIAVAAVSSAPSAAAVRVIGNSLHWAHRGPVCDGLPPCLGPALIGGTPPSGEVFMATEGIVVDSITAIVRANAVIASSSTAALSSGISLYTSRTKVRGNVVRGAEHGLYLAGSGGWVTGNDLADGDAIGIIVRSWDGSPCAIGSAGRGEVTGCLVGASAGARGTAAPAGVCAIGMAPSGIPQLCPWRLLRIRHNDVHGYAGFGISTDQVGDRYWRNDVRRNPGIACADATGDPVENVWRGNVGARSMPAGICSPAR